MSHHILSGSLPPEGSSMQGRHSRTPLPSNPVDIDQSARRADVDADGYTGSSVEDEFYSPRSSPATLSAVEGRAEAASQETPKKPAIPRERFYTPRAPTPEFLRKMVSTQSSWF